MINIYVYVVFHGVEYMGMVPIKDAYKYIGVYNYIYMFNPVKKDPFLDCPINFYMQFQRNGRIDGKGDVLVEVTANGYTVERTHAQIVLSFDKFGERVMNGFTER